MQNGLLTQSFKPRNATAIKIMRLAVVAMIAALLNACSTSEEREHEALMDQIERQVQLPSSARPLSDYARYYAAGDNGEVLAVYLITFADGSRSGESCEQLSQNFGSISAPCERTQPTLEMAAGKRRWVNEQHDLPYIDDGGCAQITVVFDKNMSVVKSAECNGTA